MKNSLVIIIPVYKTALNLLEQFSIDYLFGKVVERDIVFATPFGLNTIYYSDRYPGIRFEPFDSHYFASIAGYNELLLSIDFYQRFSRFDYLLIHQTDALTFKDRFDDWTSLGYDYIGAPWPHGMKLKFGPEDAARYGGNEFSAFVGNGGYSLRSVNRSISILEHASHLREFWRAHKLNEDCFFAFAGLLTEKFSIPTPVVASKFALELDPEHFVASNGGELPVGCHAWWKHDLAFWQKVIGTVG